MESVYAGVPNNRSEKGGEIIVEIRGKIYALGKEGYVDIIKDGFVTKSVRIEKRRFYVEEMPKESRLRIRVVGSMWKSVKPDKTLLSIVILPFFVLWPYRLVEETVVFLLRGAFNTAVLEKLMKIKVWRK